ncbi:MAG: hypothetical protein U0640_15450 [Phycisphaerales bacterium]
MTVFAGVQSNCQQGLLAQNDDSFNFCTTGTSLQSHVQMQLTQGQSVMIRVGGVNASAYGPGTLAIGQPVHCNDIDFNNDGSIFDPMDIEAFLSVYSEGPCIPATATCDSIDFNNDTSIFDPMDIDSFLSVYSEGPCF